MNQPTEARPRLSAALLADLPRSVQRPAYDRTALAVGMAHIGVGAFHRCHQADYTDDLLATAFDRWGVVGINVREPLLAGTLGKQDGLYTRVLRADARTDARVIGCILSTIDAQTSPAGALQVLAAPEIDVVSLTITEKGYCHIPSSGVLDLDRPEILHDLANPADPKSVPGLLAHALEMRMQSHGRPVTLMSCDNIPSNGTILESAVRTIAERRSHKLAGWIAGHVAFPSTMVDRIAPATVAGDIEMVEMSFGYRDQAVVTGEPFRQWVIENRFAARAPRWDLAGATFVDDVEPFELIKMRILNAAQSAFAYLGVLTGYDHTCETAADPVLARFVKRMLVEESGPTVPAVPGVSLTRYIEQAFERILNTAIQHRNHQIAADGSQKIVQRFLNAARERLLRGESIELLSLAVAAWIAYLVSAAKAFGSRWDAQDPMAGKIAAIADRIGRNSAALADEILADRNVFDASLAQSPIFRSAVARHLEGLLSGSTIAYVRRAVAAHPDEQR